MVYGSKQGNVRLINLASKLSSTLSVMKMHFVSSTFTPGSARYILSNKHKGTVKASTESVQTASRKHNTVLRWLIAPVFVLEKSIVRDDYMRKEGRLTIIFKLPDSNPRKKAVSHA